MLKKTSVRYEVEIVEWVNKIAEVYKLEKQQVYNDLLKLGITKMFENDSQLYKKLKGENND